MLRVLGAFRCDGQVVGWIYRGRFSDYQKKSEIVMSDTLETEPQLDLLRREGAVALAPLQIESCFEGPVGVLIDENTSSVAEIFAQAMKERSRTVVAGWTSAGHVVMARWFQIAGLSSDYTVSIPVALYRSAKGEELESRGVSPDQTLVDALHRWRSARDPWIEDVVRMTVSK